MASGYQRPAVSLSNVPSVRELCNRLGFESASPKETSDFTEATHNFRKSYRTSDGGAGVDLTNWNSIDVQQELAAMATQFVDESGNGTRFWSSLRRWKEYGDITYPEDKRIILDLLKQLFWKQNKYALNNQTYGEKKYGVSRDQSLDDLTPARESTHTASTASTTSTGTPKPTESTQRVSFGWQAPSQSLPSRRPAIPLPEEERANLADEMHNTLSSSGHTPRPSIFEIPDDSPPIRDSQIFESSGNRRPKRAASKATPRSSLQEGSSKRAKIGEKARGKNNKKISPKKLDRPKTAKTGPVSLLRSTRINRSVESATRPDPSTNTKPKVRGLFFIVTSPEPNYSYETWVDGQMKGKSLPKLLEEISCYTGQDCIEKLKIKLKTSFAQTMTTVHKDAGGHWEAIKQNFEEKIKESFTRDVNQQHHFQMWIEPLYQQNAPFGGAEVMNNEEIDW